MRSNQKTVLGWLALTEGGYVNHPDDPGGPTNRGVTQRTFTGWLERQDKPSRDVRTITKAEAEKIFVEDYFQPVRFDDLPSGLDYAVVDFAVNSGPMTAVRHLQKVLVDLGHKLAIDGHIGSVTLAAIAAEPEPGLIISALCHDRLAFMQGLKNWPTFKGGWTIRVMGEVSGAQDSDTGVIDRGIRMSKSLPIVGQPKAAPHRAVEPPPKTSVILAAILAILAAFFRRKS